MADEKTLITYDDYSFNDDTIITGKIAGDSDLPRKDSPVYEFPVDDGGKRVSERIPSRRIILEGVIKSPTASGLVGKLEEVKSVLMRKQKTLSITYPGSLARIYTADVDGPLAISQEHFHTSIVPFEVSFICTDPTAVQSQTTVSGVYSISSPITQLSVGISGYATAKPYIYFNTTASGSKFVLQNLTTNDSIEVATTYSGSGRQLLIDTQRGRVQLDGVDVDFRGTLPRMTIGANDLRIVTVGHSGSSLDQYFQDTALVGASYSIFGYNYYKAQSFVPTLPKLLFVELFLAFNPGGSWSATDITVQIQSDSGGKPSGTVLATATIPAFTSQTPSWKRAILSSSLTVTTGTTYWIVAKSASQSPNVYRWYTYTDTGYSSGNAAWSYDGGVSWSTPTNGYDRLFRTYGDLSGALSGKLVIEYNPTRRW